MNDIDSRFRCDGLRSGRQLACKSGGLLQEDGKGDSQELGQLSLIAVKAVSMLCACRRTA